MTNFSPHYCFLRVKPRTLFTRPLCLPLDHQRSTRRQLVKSIFLDLAQAAAVRPYFTHIHARTNKWASFFSSPGMAIAFLGNVRSHSSIQLRIHQLQRVLHLLNYIENDY